MIYHLTYSDAGGINTYIDNLISGSSDQFKIELDRDYENTITQLHLKNNRDTLIFHDPQIWKAGEVKTYSKHVVALHQDSPYYYNAIEEIGTTIDGVLCVSSVIKNNLRPRFRSKAITLGPSIPITRPIGDKHQDHYIIFIGREDGNKGVHLLPQLDQHLLNTGLKPKWTIILASRPEIHQNFRDWTATESSRIAVHESLPNSVVTQHISRHSCLVLPSQTEGHPMVVIEALANGVAPFTFHYSLHCSAHFPNDPDGTVTPSTSIEEMAQKISLFLDKTTDEQNVWRQSARAFVEVNHNPQKQRELLEGFCNSLSPSKKSPSILKKNRWKRRALRAVGLW